MRILIVDDDPAVRSSLSRALRRKGYRIGTAADGGEALELARGAGYDAVVLDVMMPGIDGIEVCRRLRDARHDTPILMLTARDTVGDRVAGLDAGAEDYLVKPFDLEELFARLRVLLRRNTEKGRSAGVLRFGDLELDPRRPRGQARGAGIRLTRTEYLLLEQFMRHPRQVLTRSVIFARVWGYDFGGSLGVYIGYLRRKLEQGGGSRLIHTVRGVGYVLREA
jgi:two-component system, OmpR family, response regulator MprA